MQAHDTQCQAIKANRLQCANPAFVLVNNIPYCRNDFNWLVAQKKDSGDMSAQALKDMTFPLDPENNDVKIEAYKIIDSNMGVLQTKENTPIPDTPITQK